MTPTTHHLQPSSQTQSGALYLVPTPIGNLKDITLRALETLQQVDAIICEDTRVTNRLLAHYEIKKPLHIYHDHSPSSVKEQIITLLQQGKQLALVSDAGTPLLSDPGYKLVHTLIEREISVISLPGPSSILTALTASGLPTDQFYFLGFLPATTQKRQNCFHRMENIPASLIFFDSPRRIKDTLKDLHTVFPNRHCAIMRELTKKFEEHLYGTAAELLELLENREIKGEIVGIIAPPVQQGTVETEEELLALLSASLEKMSLKDAVEQVSQLSSFKKKTVYQHALSLLK